MSKWNVNRSELPARTLVVSERDIRPLTWLCLGYEFEDIVREIEPADMISPLPQKGVAQWRMGLKLSERYSQGRFSLASPYRPTEPTSYDLVFVQCGSITDLLFIGQPESLTRLAAASACYISELWADRLPLQKEFVKRLQCFDQVFIGCAGPVEQLAAQIGRPCHYLAPAVDALALCPYPNPTTRPIDFLSVGRRPEPIHLALLAHARQHPGFFYIRDTIEGLAKGHVRDTRDHREQLIALLKRAKYFIANRPKFDSPVGKDQHEVGYRFFEGAAAGCVMIGEKTRNDAFEELFGWPDSVIPNPVDPSKIIELFESLEADPSRVNQIRRRNVIQSLHRHDWAHRWKAILDTLQLPASPGLEQRLERLSTLATEIGRQDAEGGHTIGS